MEWVQANGYRPGAGPSYEVYRNTPMKTPPDRLVTELYQPLG